jgi:succinyl-CoA synthetase beta subunit
LKIIARPFSFFLEQVLFFLLSFNFNLLFSVNMNIHEYQAKIILRKFGIPVPPFKVAANKEQVQQMIEQMALNEAVLKVQIHAGGRGKAGGVKLARERRQILDYAEQLIGMRIVNNQTGKEGIVSKEILISPLVAYTRELYLGAIIDRQKAQAMLIASPDGGVEIEEVAAKTPDRILQVPIGPQGKVRNYQHIQIAKFMQWSGPLAEQGRQIVDGLAKAFMATDASLIEINPLVETASGELLALDAKFSLDDNALFRQPEIAAFYDASQLPPSEAHAKQYDLAFVALDGNIGCMVNGAGLAMATMDIIHFYGGAPANFLDVGGSATQEKVAEGFKILLADPKIKAILVNIFGGIMNCVTLAAGIIAAASGQQVPVPLIIRMEGTSVEQGRKMLEDSGLNIIIANELAEAAEKAVAAAERGTV